MNKKKIIDELVKLYHHDFNSKTLMCWDENKIIIEWYSDEYEKVIIDPCIEDKKEGVKLYEELCKYINFLDLSYELEEFS